MSTLDTIFSSSNEVVTKLRECAKMPDYGKIFFEHLGPELTKIHKEKKK